MNNHSPICTCTNGFTGDPFTRCYAIPPPSIVQQEEIRDPCNPTPCGPFSDCRNFNNMPSCTCLPNYLGTPPNCRPECTINSDCPSDKACIRTKCVDPCQGACGISAMCTVFNHRPNCLCIDGYIGDPFSSCNPSPPPCNAMVFIYRLISLFIVFTFNFQQKIQYLQILAIHRHVGKMLNVTMAYAHACVIIMAIHILDVDLNVF